MAQQANVTGVILAAGNGARMRLLAAGPKANLPVCNRPLISYHLAMLHSMGIRDVVVVVGFLAPQVISAAEAARPPGITLRYVDQPERQGIAHALFQTRALVADRMVVILADTYVVPGDLDAALGMLGGKVVGVLSVRRVASPHQIRKECTVRFDSGGNLVQIREKPAVPFNDLKPCGVYFFTTAVFDAIASTPPSPLRGEVEISDAVQGLVNAGHRVHQATSVRWDTNLNVPLDLLSANLAELRQRDAGAVVHPNAQVEESAELRNAVVGEHARVGAGARLENVVVLPAAVVEPGRHLADAIVGVRGVITAVRQAGESDARASRG